MGLPTFFCKTLLYRFLNEFNDIFSLHALINIMSIVFQITVTMVAVVSVGLLNVDLYDLIINRFWF